MGCCLLKTAGYAETGHDSQVLPLNFDLPTPQRAPPLSRPTLPPTPHPPSTPSPTHPPAIGSCTTTIMKTAHTALPPNAASAAGTTTKNITATKETAICSNQISEVMKAEVTDSPPRHRRQHTTQAHLQAQRQLAAAEPRHTLQALHRPLAPPDLRGRRLARLGDLRRCISKRQ